MGLGYMTSLLFISFIFFITINSGATLHPDKRIQQPDSMPFENDNYEIFLDSLTASAKNIYQFELPVAITIFF